MGWGKRLLASQLEEKTMKQDDFDQYQCSPAGVRYALEAGTTIQGVDMAHLDDLITLTVAQLPDDVREFVYDQCTFISVGGSDIGAAFPPQWAPAWLIVLSSHVLADRTDDDVMSIIAHEIAHARCGHSMFESDGSAADGDRMEIEASQLAAAWGFAGRGTTPMLHGDQVHP